MKVVIIGDKAAHAIKKFISSEHDYINIDIYSTIQEFYNVSNNRVLTIDRMLLLEDALGAETTLDFLNTFDLYINKNYPSLRFITLVKDESLADNLSRIFISPNACHICKSTVIPSFLTELVVKDITVLKSKYGYKPKDMEDEEEELTEAYEELVELPPPAETDRGTNEPKELPDFPSFDEDMIEEGFEEEDSVEEQPQQVKPVVEPVVEQPKEQPKEEKKGFFGRGKHKDKGKKPKRKKLSKQERYALELAVLKEKKRLTELGVAPEEIALRLQALENGEEYTPNEEVTNSEVREEQVEQPQQVEQPKEVVKEEPPKQEDKKEDKKKGKKKRGGLFGFMRKKDDEDAKPVEQEPIKDNESVAIVEDEGKDTDYGSIEEELDFDVVGSNQSLGVGVNKAIEEEEIEIPMSDDSDFWGDKFSQETEEPNVTLEDFEPNQTEQEVKEKVVEKETDYVPDTEEYVIEEEDDDEEIIDLPDNPFEETIATETITTEKKLSVTTSGDSWYREDKEKMELEEEQPVNTVLQKQEEEKIDIEEEYEELIIEEEPIDRYIEATPSPVIEHTKGYQGLTATVSEEQTKSIQVVAPVVEEDNPYEQYRGTTALNTTPVPTPSLHLEEDNESLTEEYEDVYTQGRGNIVDRYKNVSGKDLLSNSKVHLEEVDIQEEQPIEYKVASPIVQAPQSGLFLDTPVNDVPQIGFNIVDDEDGVAKKEKEMYEQRIKDMADKVKNTGLMIHNDIEETPQKMYIPEIAPIAIDNESTNMLPDSTHYDELKETYKRGTAPQQVEKLVEVPVEKIVERVIEVPVEKVIEVEKIVEKVIEVPVEVPVERERIVETVVERTIDTDGRYKQYVNGVRMIVVTGDRKSGVTRTALNAASYFARKGKTLLVDFDLARSGSLYYLGLEDIANEPDAIQNGLYNYNSINMIDSLVYKHPKSMFDCLINLYGSEYDDKKIDVLQKNIASQRNYNTIIVDCPIENLHKIREVVLHSEIIMCVEPNIPSLINTIIALGSYPEEDSEFIVSLYNHSQYYLAKSSDVNNFKQSLDYVAESFALSSERFDWSLLKLMGTKDTLGRALSTL